MLLESLQPLGPAGRPDDAEPVALEVRADERRDVRLVLDEEDGAALCTSGSRASNEHDARRSVRAEDDLDVHAAAEDARGTRPPARQTVVRAVTGIRTVSPKPRRTTSARGRTRTSRPVSVRPALPKARITTA